MAKIERIGGAVIEIWAVAKGFLATGSYQRHSLKTPILGILGHLGRKPPFVREKAF
ncbi:MAG: hypothetical protein NZ602_14210 [Thermoguttaceae bacterium]|nr:hypothetical protein [Thermoguttaceae bacterium]